MDLRFVGEQDGPAERRLKEGLRQMFDSKGNVQVAYLSIAEYGDKTRNVVLCLRSRREDEADLVGEVGRIFASIFNSQVHLDVYFIEGARESEIRAVCRPFYEPLKQ